MAAKHSRRDYVQEYYDKNFADGGVDEEVRAVALFLAKEAGGRVLDCGCGPVPQVWALCMPKMTELHAVDLPAESIEFVKEKIRTVNRWQDRFAPYQQMIEAESGPLPERYIARQVAKIKSVQEADMTVSLPFPPGYFDTVVSLYSLGCVPDEVSLSRALKNIAKVLKPGGTFIHVNTDGNNRNTVLPEYTWQGLDQSSALIEKYLVKHGFVISRRESHNLPQDPERMYDYSALHFLAAVKN